ncbi:MAG TPA: (Fe-S)-binding protein, partial [Bacteroidetes bacterium]|nr:(Fe-S)-binding protein [Bacteroidota bacterium]
GCAGSYDARAQKVSKAFAKLLNKAGVSFAILGSEESCCGDPARRAGNEFVFQMLALQNIEVLNGYGVKKIVTACPHGYNTLKNEYPELGGKYEVIHHTQFINQLIKEGKLDTKDNNYSKETKVTYHDSCYMGRVNGEYEAPREVLSSSGIEVKEMHRSKERGFCCGAGGAQMFKEEEKGENRVNEERAKEAIGTGAKVIAANCPFCITMLEDGLKSFEKEDEIKVMDIAEILAQGI